MLKFALVSVFFYIVSAVHARAESDCDVHGRAFWNDNVISMVWGCEDYVTAKSWPYFVSINSDGKIFIKKKNNRQIISVVANPVIPPASLTISSDGNWFIVNDGEGSGQTSKLRVYQQIGNSFEENFSIRDIINNYFWRLTRCNEKDIDPDLIGFNWEGDNIWIYASSSIHSSCKYVDGRDFVFGFYYDLKNNKIIQILNEVDFYKKFPYLSKNKEDH